MFIVLCQQCVKCSMYYVSSVLNVQCHSITYQLLCLGITHTWQSFLFKLFKYNIIYLISLCSGYVHHNWSCVHSRKHLPAFSIYILYINKNTLYMFNISIHIINVMFLRAYMYTWHRHSNFYCLILKRLNAE